MKWWRLSLSSYSHDCCHLTQRMQMMPRTSTQPGNEKKWREEPLVRHMCQNLGQTPGEMPSFPGNQPCTAAPPGTPPLSMACPDSLPRKEVLSLSLSLGPGSCPPEYLRFPHLMYILDMSPAAASSALALAGSTICLHLSAANITLWWAIRAATYSSSLLNGVLGS